MKRILACIAMVGCLAGAWAQTPIRTGKLANGLTYYIKHNEEPKGQADFYLSQRIGSVQERDNERGLAHFLEHMAFNGSEHFPGNSLITYLESIGVKFGADLNAYTSTDETVYNICRVPTARVSSLDSCLLVLRDWSAALSLNDSDINNERGVIEGEWRHRSAASNRILERILPNIYPGSAYGHRMPIGLMSVVKNFKPQTLRDFYHRWHRPENQAVIVVGDFDVDRMEAKVKEMFGPLKNPAGAPAYKPVAVPDNKKMIVAIGSDPEQGQNVLQLHLKHRAPKLTGTDYWRRQVGEELLGLMLAERFDSLEQLSSCPWNNMGIGVGKFLMTRNLNSLIMRGTVKKGREKDAFAAWYAEILRVLDHGFTPEELDAAKTEYMGSLTTMRRKAPFSNTKYAGRLSRSFLDGNPVLTVEQELDSLQAVIDGMTPEYCSELLASMADRNGSGRNMVVVSMRPEGNDVPVLSARDFEKALAEVNDMDLQPYSVKAVTGPLLASEPVAGTISSVDSLDNLGCRVYTLSNGVKVYAKKTDFKAGQFYMIGAGPGGFSQRYTAALAPQMKMLNNVMTTCKYGDFNSSQLRRRLAGKDLAVSVKIDNTEEEVELSAGPDDRDDAFRLLYLKLTDVRPDPAAFAIWKAASSERMSAPSSPVQIMGDSIHANVYNHHPLGIKEDTATVAALDLDTIIDLYRDRFADMSDFTFYVCGDFEWNDLEHHLSRYIASLPAAGRMEKSVDIGYHFTPGRVDNDFKVAMQTPTAICYSMLSAPMEYNLSNYLTAKIAGEILGNRLLKDLREDKGWTYSVTGHCSINPDLDGEMPSVLWPVYIKTAPEHALDTRMAVEQAYEKLASEDPTADEIDPIRSYLEKNLREGLVSNAFWLSAMRAYHKYGFNYAADYLPALNSITPANVRKFTRHVVDANRMRLMLTPRD